MNGSQSTALALCHDLISGTGSLTGIEVLICPPAILLHRVSQALEASSISTGAQDIDEHESGAYTGQIAASMVRDAGGICTILGHSERRTLYGESDARVAAKVNVARSQGLMPIVCVGETRKEREDHLTEKVVIRQVDSILEGCGIDTFQQGVIAYEPVWAIGTGLTATPDQAQAVHALIRHRLGQQDADMAARCRILYGGSMKSGNAAELLEQPDIDGGLVGGASLMATEFLAICQAASDTVGRSGD